MRALLKAARSSSYITRTSAHPKLRITLVKLPCKKTKVEFSTKNEREFTLFFPLHMSPQFKTALTPTRKFQSRLGKNESFDWIRPEEKERTYLNIENRNFQKQKKTPKSNNVVQTAFQNFLKMASNERILKRYCNM